MMKRIELTLFIFYFLSVFINLNSEQLIYTKTTKTLVVLDDWHYVETHSNFWSQLRGKIFLNFFFKAMNFDLDFKMVEDSSIKLTYFGEYLYSNIIFMAPSLNDGKYKKTKYFFRKEK